MDTKLIEFDNLRIRYGVHRAISKKEYFSGFKTNFGVIEKKEWTKRAEELISKYNEAYITEALIKYLRDECVWLKNVSEEEIRIEALERHASRLFERKEWVDYSLFLEKYLNNCKSDTKIKTIKTIVL